MDFLVARDDLHRCRFDDAPAPEPGAGQALLRVDAFGLSANNITYAMFGETMSYWDFFPAPEGWGRVPVWGFAEVVASEVAALEAGTRVFGYLPPSTELLVAPAHVSANGFTDSSAHRAALPGAYNRYARTDADPLYDAEHEDEQMLLRPLFLTSYLIDDFLGDSDFFGAEIVVLSSASSKTASALAFQLSLREDVLVVGLTSSASAEFARTLCVYDHVLAYDQLDSLPDGRAVYVDMADDRMGAVPDGLPGPRPMFFFAPDRVRKRAKDWGAVGLQQRMADAWHPYVAWACGWLEVDRGHGADALQSAYLDLLDGRIDPARADVLSL
jgi:NADPH:quinone reductase-like Zn-dependent oxidoreductase